MLLIGKGNVMGLFFNRKATDSNIPPILNASEHHMALLFLLDTSGNMSDRDPVTGVIPINELNDAINRFKYEVCQDPHTKDVLDVAVMEYNEGFRIVQDFSPVEYLQPIKVKAKGNAYVCDALNAAVDMVSERSRFYRRSGAEPYKPWIVVITNGMTMDEAAAIDHTVARVNDQVNKNNVAVWTLMAGDMVSENINASWLFHQLCGKRVLKLSGCDFTGFFDWTNKSMRAVSQSSPGEKIQAQRLPQTIEIDPFNAIQETAVSVARCSRTNEIFGMRHFKKHGAWEITWAFPVRYVNALRQQDCKIIENPGTSDDYPGCPYCGGETAVVCTQCGQVTCAKSNDFFFKCEWCGLKGTIQRNVAVNITATNDIDM